MRKSNLIIIAILVVASIVFLWLWYYLGFNYVDDPLDLVLSIIWWILVIVVCIVIHNVEKKRQRTIRTAFLGPQLIYNSEAGIVRLKPGEEYVSALQKIISSLDYSFDREEAKDENNRRIRFQYIVRTDKFSNDGNTWEGEVVNVMRPNDPRTFESKEELTAILGSAATA